MKSFFLLLLLLLTSQLSLAQKLEKVSLQLQWLDQFQFAGYYIAIEKGFYKEAGLAVELLPFDNTVNSVDSVLNKKATYGIGRSSLIIDRSKGKEIVLLASAFQSSPSILLARKDSNIKTAKDFVGKKVMMTADASADVAMQAMITRHGVSIADMITLRHSFDINDLINKKTDLMASYASNEPFLLQEKGIEYTIFDPKDHGFDFYSDILFTSDNEIKNHRQRAMNFTTASIKGWVYAFSHIEETVELILEKYNVQNKSRAALLFEANALKELAYYNNKDPGHIDKKKIEKIYDFYNVMGLLENRIDINSFVMHEHQYRDRYLLSIKEKAYLEEKKEVKLCIEPNWMPFDKLKDGKHIGMNAEFMQLIAAKIEIPITLVPTKGWSESLDYIRSRQCDILSLAMETPERKKYMNFTRSYLVIPLVLATTTDKFFITDLNKVLDKKLGAVKGYAFTELLKSQYPSLNLIEVENIEQGLEEVARGNLYAFLDNLTSIGYQMQKNYQGILKISGRIENQNWEFGIGVRNDDLMLLNILDKAIDSIDEKTRQGILNQWISIKYEQNFDYTLLWQILVVVVIIFAFMVYRYQIMKNYNQQLQQLSTLDTLTSLYNRRYLDAQLESALALARRYNTPFSLILMDIDNFKSINDTYGHDKGDRVLQEISTILLDYSRSNDIVGRWGGEEFLIICAHSPIQGAREVAEKMCQKIADNVTELERPVTASFGVIEYKNGDTNNSMMQRADNALYQAKAEGKNRVIAAD